MFFEHYTVYNIVIIYKSYHVTSLIVVSFNSNPNAKPTSNIQILKRITTPNKWCLWNINFILSFGDFGGKKMNWQCLQAELDTKRHVVWPSDVDESTVEMFTSGRLFFYWSNFDKLLAKATTQNHSFKVNVWGWLSYRGRTSVCIFSVIVDSEIY